MEITSINITPIVLSKGLIGFASLVLNNVLELNSIGIYLRVDQKDGKTIRLTYPHRKLKNNSLVPYFKVINETFNQQLTEAVEKELKQLELFNFKVA